MISTSQYRRLFCMVGMLVVGFVGLAYRLVELQWVRHDELKEAVEGRTRHKVLLEPRRGDIRDRTGKLLVTSEWVKTVGVDPSIIGPYAAPVARTVSSVLGMNEAQLYRKLCQTHFVDDDGVTRLRQWIPLARKVRKPVWERLQAAMAEIDLGIDESALSWKERQFVGRLKRTAVYAQPVEDQLRVYPHRSLASHVLGFVGRGFLETPVGSVDSSAVGAAGIEKQFDQVLSGVPGWRIVSIGRRGKEIVPLREYDVAPRPGHHVVLTIDARIQEFLETRMAEAMAFQKAKSISGVVVRPATGEILAMANLPTFDPNRVGAANPAERRNRAITDIAEPGSTFKIVVVSGALEDRKVSLADRFDCENGAWYYAGKRLRDHHRYGILSVQEIISKSSNIGAAKIGIYRLGKERLHDYITGFGYGERTGIPLPGEVRGIVHPPERWKKITLSRIPMGHSVAATLLQTTMAMAAIANDGVLMRPMLVDRLEDPDGRIVAKYEPGVVRRVLSPATSKEMVRALKSVVETGGTATRASLDYYTVAGKTGTAEKISAGGRYDTTRNYTSFVGFFPADDPEVCIAITLDEPRMGRGGGTTAAPIFRDVAEEVANYLNVRPDRFLEGQSSLSVHERWRSARRSVEVTEVR